MTEYRQRTTESRARTHIAHTSHNISRLNPSLCAATRGSEAAHLAAAAATARQAFIRGRPQRKGGPAGPCGSRPPLQARRHCLGGRDLQVECRVHGGVPEQGPDRQVFDQDVFNMGKVQLGLETTHKSGVVLSNYQESKVRWLHQKLSEWCEEK